MPFDNGNIAFMMCHMPEELTKESLTRFSQNRGQSLEHVRDEPQLGFVTGRHLLETDINEDNAYCGGFLHLCLRTAVRKIPSGLFRAECRVHELGYMQEYQTFNVPRKERKRIQEEVHDRLIKEMPPTLSGTSFVYDNNHSMLYLGATSLAQIDAFLIFFHEAFGFEPIPLYPDLIVRQYFGQDPDSLYPLVFTPTPPEEVEPPTIGRDFITWLWYFIAEEGGKVNLDPQGEFTLWIDGPLTFASEMTGAMESVVRKGAPTVSAEAKAALTTGKKLKNAKFIIAHGNDQWCFGLDADSFAVKAMKLPDGEKLDPMSTFQERVMFLNTYREIFLKLLDLFLQQVADDSQTDKLNEELVKWTQNMKVR